MALLLVTIGDSLEHFCFSFITMKGWSLCAFRVVDEVGRSCIALLDNKAVTNTRRPTQSLVC